MGSKQGSHCCLSVWRISRKSEGLCCGQGRCERVSCHQGPGAGTWVGLKWVLPWRGPSDPILPWSLWLPAAVGLWVPRHITEVLGFCTTDVVPHCLGPTKRGRTSKEHMPQQRPFPAASCPACSEPYVQTAPQALLERSFL